MTTFEDLGCAVEPAWPDFTPERLWTIWLTLRQWVVAGNLAPLYRDPAKRVRLKPEAQWEIEGGLEYSAMAVFEASVGRSEWYEALRRLFETYDYVVLPTAQVFPFDVSMHWPDTVNGVAMDTYHRWMEVVIPATLAGCPAINVPAGFNSTGLPMGLQIMGPHHGDFAVLQLARAYEEAMDGVFTVLPPALLPTET
jgi:amidase